jgi:hypothetical protein
MVQTLSQMKTIVICAGSKTDRIPSSIVNIDPAVPVIATGQAGSKRTNDSHSRLMRRSSLEHPIVAREDGNDSSSRSRGAAV